MTPVSNKTVLEALNWRYATKKFDATKKIPAETWSLLEESLVLSPSSFGLQPWKFLVIQSPELRAKLKEVSWGQTQVVEASHYVVFLGQKGLGTADVDRYLARTVELRGGSVEALKGYRDIILGSLDGARNAGYLDIWQSRQVYIALGQFMTAAALVGVDACPMEGLDARQYESILGVDTSKWTVLVACAVGYRAADDKYATAAKIRYKASELISHL